jgi:crotonobetaine/carnitine-CoA ligase
MNLGTFLRQAVAAVPQQTFVQCGRETLSYEAFEAASNQAAHALHDLGLRAGERVALVLPNSPLFLVLWFGAAKLGAIMTAWNPEYTPYELAPLLAHAEPRVVVTAPEVLTRVGESIRASRQHAVVLHSGQTTLDDREPIDAVLRGRSVDPPRVEIKADNICTMIYTSGTTGRPKGVLHTHATYVLTGEAFPHWLGLTGRDRLFTSLPLFHINAQAYSTMGSLALRTTLILAERFHAHRFLEELAETGATTFNFIGAMVLILRKQPPSSWDRAHSVRITYGVPVLPPDVRDAIEQRFGFRILAGYGLTEATFGSMEPLHEPRRPFSIGKPRQHPALTFQNEMRVVTDGDRDLPAGEVGELALRNPALMREYYHDADLTTQALRNGWLHTEDLGYRDADGFFYFVARRRDIIRRRGENISALEIEMVVNEHPQVADSAAIGVPSELGDEEVKLIVVKRPGASFRAEDIVAWCATRLAKFKLPSDVEFRSELPKTATGRILKHLLTGAEPPRAGAVANEDEQARS